ncbi:hypothetical protein [Streptomyces fumanus]|uniref:Secreted protein n=1 Tax=Streptomyces fumanus TaxID=67302 RepID=A0A919E0Q9_9ACTN|nr:hypothetical protein [Streptomyces fumanus]GHE98787.1 hypothetical protein GCM10018772_24050 [Streptomyces fumanus]
MRTRHALAGAALGAVMALGVLAAPAQAAPIQAGPSASAAVSVNTPPTTQVWGHYGSYLNQFECNIAGSLSGYSRWYCVYSDYSDLWELYVDFNS